MSGGLVRWHVTMSVDGFIAGPGDSMDWFLGQGYRASGAADEVIVGAGAILTGRRSHDVGRAMGQQPYGGAWRVPVLVLTHQPAEVDGPDVRGVSAEIGEAVAQARAAAGRRDVVVLGAHVARQCLDAGLLDDILIHVAPVLLGTGVRLLDRPGAAPVRLRQLDRADPALLPDLHFAVPR
ncbi:dihydrofolate reductase [Micromonospora kangleipakensis]|uniref:Dihydrofolate reductase n=1 Tax=Micromonospora kangleipakensis TaxID=1077942 RepID=A0A4Q8BJ03_9ACTN|nr:dihydrofolate reductase family protein [Micromonospora kangleipakensis]RZU77531.1 dihydrofolate reductase [Micromonospora kangleipakensis]